MRLYSGSRFFKSLAFILPLAVGGGVWWLAGLQSPGGGQTSATVAQAAEEKQVPLVPMTRLGGSFGLPATEVQAEDVFAKFEAWAAAYDDKNATKTVAEGVQLARQRRDALKTLIQTDPRAALARALPWTLRNKMPQEVAPLLEQRVSALAEYSVKGARMAPESRVKVAPVQRHAVIDGQIYEAYVYGRREWLGSKNDLPVEGIAVDQSLAILERPVRELETGEPQPARGVKPAAQDEHQTNLPPAAPAVLVSGGQGYQTCCSTHASAMEASLGEMENRLGPNMGYDVAESAWTEGAKDILVIRVDFSDVTGVPQNINPVVAITPNFATNLINDVTNTFMSEVSYGKTSVNLNTADVTPVLRMPRTAAFYAVNNDADRLRLDSLAAATAAGYVIGDYDRQMVVFSWIGTSRVPNSRFGWAGLGQINGPFTWYNGYFDDRVVPHELGHNLSLWHANLWQVGGTNPVDLDDGFAAEYEDPFDGMGNGFYAPINLLHFNPWFLNRIDWLPNSAVLNVVAPGTYRIYRFDHPGAPLSRPLAIKITKDATRNYWIGYRRRFAGLSGSLADVSAGAYIVWGFNSNRGSELIDVDTPGFNPNDASLNVGGVLRDTDAGLVMRVISAGGTGVDEYIDVRVDQDNRIYPLQTSYDVDESAGTVTLTLARSGEPNETSTVSVSTQDGSAVSPSDYTATTTTVTWIGTDVSNKTVTIPITANAVREGPESFLVNITLTVGVTSVVSGSPVTVNIREPGMTDSSFVHGSFSAPGSVRNLVVEPDGQIAFVGGATILGPTRIDGLGRLSSAGVLDMTFNRSEGASPLPVLALARQADGKFVMGGAFTSLRGQPLAGIGRVENDGGIDSSFDPGSGAQGPGATDSTVRAIAIQADGRILVGGDFTTFDGQARLGLARLLPDGSLDDSFLTSAIPGISEMEVEAIVLLPNGKMVVGGLIRTSAVDELFQGGYSSGVLRLNADGSVDTSFDIGAGAHVAGNSANVQRVTSLALQQDGKVLVGGMFTAFNGTSASRLVRLNLDGSLDTAFQTALGVAGLNGLVRCIEVQGDGRILLAGDFTSVSGTARNFIARLQSSGAMDTGFDVGLPLLYGGGSFNVAHQVKMQPDARVLLATDATGSGDTTVRRVFSGQLGRSGVVEFVNGSASVNEGSQTMVEVRRTGGSLGAVSVNYALIAGSADASDYAESSGTLTWANGDTASKFIPVQATGDVVAESTEFFNVQLGVPVGGIFLGDRSQSTISIIDPGAAGFPTVHFAADSSSLDESSTATRTVTVELSEAADETVIVPLVLGGSATNAGVGSNGDYRISPAPPLVFTAGETSKTLTITSLQDNAVEGTETLTLRINFPTGPALVGSPNLHTMTVVDDDQPPVVSGPPNHLIVALGRPAGPFESNVAGSLPLTLEWYLNNKKIPGISDQAYTVPAATLKDAGTYFMKAKNRLAEGVSAASELVVVDASTRTIVLPVGTKATFKMDAAGNNIGYTWRKLDGNLAANTRATTRFDKSISISGLTLEDSGTYVCRVSSPLAVNPLGETPNEKFMDGAVHILKVVDTAPEFLTLEDGDFLPGAIVSGLYEYAIEVNPTVNKAPMSYTATGLPAGLKVDAVSGVIRGRPTVRKDAAYDVTLTAANKAGRATVKVKLQVDAFPANVAGDYVAILGRQLNLNQEIGGRLDLKITATGAFSGKLVHGGLTHTLKGVMDVFRADSQPPLRLPSGSLRIVRTGKPVPRPLDLYFEIDPGTRRLINATVGDGFFSLNFSGWKQTWDAKNNKADAFDGYHTFALEMPDAIPNVPRGYGHGSITVSLAGVASIAGKTGDGESITAGSFISETGEIAFFLPLYKTKPTGSMLGKLQLERGTSETDDADNRLSGLLDWLRPETTTAKARVYAAGFGPVEIRAFGGRYLPQTLALGLPVPGQGRVIFTDAGPAPSRNPNATFDLGLKNKVTLVGSNAALTSLKVDSAKGSYSGKFALEDTNPLPTPPTIKRPVTYQGMVVPTEDGLRGYGYFTLPQLPSADPPTTPTTSPILSGKSLFTPVED